MRKAAESVTAERVKLHSSRAPGADALRRPAERSAPVLGHDEGVTKRQPRWVYDEGDEPDPRFTLANERTFLAWVRTSLAMLAGGVALHALNTSGPEDLRTIVAVGLIALGAAVGLGSFVRWARVERAMRRHEPLPSFGIGAVMTAALVVVSVLLVIILV